MNAGSAVPSMTTDILYAMELRIPSGRCIGKVLKIFVSPLYKAISDNSVENKKLAEVRGYFVVQTYDWRIGCISVGNVIILIY